MLGEGLVVDKTLNRTLLREVRYDSRVSSMSLVFHLASQLGALRSQSKCKVN